MKFGFYKNVSAWREEITISRWKPTMLVQMSVYIVLHLNVFISEMMVVLRHLYYKMLIDWLIWLLFVWLPFCKSSFVAYLFNVLIACICMLVRLTSTINLYCESLWNVDDWCSMNCCQMKIKVLTRYGPLWLVVSWRCIETKTITRNR